MTTDRHRYTGFRMMDVRMTIAADGKGLDTVEKIAAGHYAATTLDGRHWTITQNRHSKLWYGADLDRESR